MKKSVIDRLAVAVFSLVESDLAFENEIGYSDACDLLGLSADEKSAVLALIDDDLRVI
mgnify:CR=1 FL=1